MYSSPILVLALAALASARTDLSGCVSSQTVAYGGASLLWYVPGTGEICSFLDCGGGRAPPKTTVPGCPSYQGTATYSPDFIKLATSTTPEAASSTAPSTAMITGSQTTVEASPETTSEVASSLSESVSSAAQITSSASAQITSTPSTLVAAGGNPTTSSNSSGSSVGAGSKNSTNSSTGTAPISSATGNAGAFMSINGAVGVLAAGFALLL